MSAVATPAGAAPGLRAGRQPRSNGKGSGQESSRGIESFLAEITLGGHRVTDSAPGWRDRTHPFGAPSGTPVERESFRRGTRVSREALAKA